MTATASTNIQLTPREHAARGLDLLAARLQPIIADTLAPHLNGIDWPILLSELDRLKGKTHRAYAASDVQAQLRVLTERLGTLGYPFDDHTRSVSTVAGELRIVRNRIFHQDDLTLPDAWRALDFVVRLLARLGDAEGSAEAEVRRDGILRLTPPDASTGVKMGQMDGRDEIGQGRDKDTSLDEEDEDVRPDREVYAREDTSADHGPLPNERLDYEPWTVVPAGQADALDNLKNQQNRELVRALIEEIVDHEGPVERTRLAKLTGWSLGLGRIEERRIRQILHQVAVSTCQEQDGWVWPSDIDPETWTEFRPNGSDVDRAFEHIAPQEIRNASAFLRRRHPGDTKEEHRRRILQTFGRKRLTKAYRKHLDLALEG